MNRLVLTLLLLCCSGMLHAQHDEYGHHRRSHRERGRAHHKPLDNTFTVNAGIGYYCGYLGVKGGLEYERFLTREGLISLHAGIDGNRAGTVSFGEIDYGEVRTRLTSIAFVPGLRVHPMGNDGRVDIGLGIALPMGRANRREYRVDYMNKSTTVNTADFYGSVLFQFNVDFRSRRGGLFGIYIHAGYNYANPGPVLYRYGDDDRAIVQFGLRFGGQW